MFKQLSRIEENDGGYVFECSWDGKEDEHDPELIDARTECSLDASDISWTTEKSARHWIAMAQGIDVWTAVVSGEGRGKSKNIS